MNKEQRKRRALYLNFALCYLLFALCYLSCYRSDASRPPSPTVEVGQSDKELDKIADNARNALPIFLRNLARPENGASNFYVKYPVTTEVGSVEQVWLGNIRIKEGVYYGNFANKTMFPGKNKVKVIDTDKITDWMYIQNGRIIGGRSIKYLLEKIPEEKRSGDQRRILGMFE